jgi:tetratricopeptide (TPR) repeat protein
MANNANNSFIRAITDYNTAISLKPTAPYFNKRGMVYLTIGEFQKALEDFNKAN